MCLLQQDVLNCTEQQQQPATAQRSVLTQEPSLSQLPPQEAVLQGSAQRHLVPAGQHCRSPAAAQRGSSSFRSLSKAQNINSFLVF